MNVFLFIVGGLLTFIGGILFCSFHSITKNEENWNEFMKSGEGKFPSVSEEELYKLVVKIKNVNFYVLLFGIMCIAGGILFVIL